jgi:SulP family sulfate permease
LARPSPARSSWAPGWLTGYRRAWLLPDLVAGLIVWGVVTPQAVAYAQIAGLPPSAGLAAAPGALLAYALLGTSRTLVVSATTATSALSAAAIGPLADGDALRFAALSAGSPSSPASCSSWPAWCASAVSWTSSRSP